MCTGKLSHRACTRSCASHIHTHTNSAHGRVWRSIANDLRDIGRHVRSILPNGSSNFHFAPVMPTYVCPSFLSSFSISLSLSLSPVSAIFDPYPSLFHEEPYTSSASKKEKEREREQPKEKEKGGGNLPTSRIALISHPCEIASAAHLPDDWQPLFLSFSILLPSPILVLTTVRCSLLASSFLQNWTARWNSQFATSILHLSLSFSLSGRERPLSDSPSLGERPIPLEDPLLPRRNLGQTRVREERETKCRFRTILERSISYERCRSPLAYKTFIKSPTKWTGGRRRRCTRKAGNRQQLAVRWSSNSSGLFQPTLFYRSLLLLESFRTPMAWPG